jgi:lysine-specific demethylase 8
MAVEQVVTALDCAPRLPIARLENPRDEELRHRLEKRREPFIFSGRIDAWKARRWTLSSLKGQFGECVVKPMVDLPADGVPYFWEHKGYARSMPLAAFVDYVTSRPDSQCYLPQNNIRLFPGVENAFDFGDLTGPGGYRPTTSIWLGTAGTHSGLHFDRRDNLLAQVLGRKRVVLAAPDQARALYPIKDMFEKSSVDPVAPDYVRYPRFRHAQLLEGVLEPGDVLHIPRMWWHYLRALDTSISLNCWYGDEVRLQELFRVVNAGGLGHWATLFRDAFVYGACHRPYQTRLRSDLPSGKFVYEVVESGIRRRLSRSNGASQHR